MRDSRKRPLAVAVLLALGATCSGDAVADTVIVDNCSDQEDPFSTSLRRAIDIAGEGDIVDLSGLACSTITLEHGELVVAQNSLDLLGPYDHELTIDAHGYSRAINHVGTGSLAVRYLNAIYGTASGNGGCVLSSGTLYLLYATLSHCTATNKGGAASAPNLRTEHSRISDNSALVGGGEYSRQYLLFKHADVLDNHSSLGGGAAYAGQDFGAGQVKIYDSNFRNNSAGFASAVWSFGDAHVTRTTVSANSAAAGSTVYAAGHLYVTDSTVDGNATPQSSFGALAANYVDVVDSTISGNTAPNVGGIWSNTDVQVRNSTIVFNRAAGGSADSPGGIYARGSATIISSIVARNTHSSNSGAADLRVDGGLTAYTSLIMSANKPSVSLTVDPRLGPLADHGGGRRTHAVLPGSPVVDVGSNPLSLQYDERGSTRVVGGGPDIGAYERQVDDDQLLYDGFESS